MLNSSGPKRYYQKYRKQWEELDEFRGWLKPYPKDNKKAYCNVCNYEVKAHLCDLKKHARAKRHIQAKELVKTIEIYKKIKQDGNIDTNSNCTSDEEDSLKDNTNSKWSQENVELFFKHIKTYWKDLRDGIRENKDIWEDIAGNLMKDGVNVSGFECEAKFKSLKSRYQYVIKENLAGNSVNYKIDYFNSIHELLQEDTETINIINERMELDQGLLDEETIILEEANNDDEESEWSEDIIKYFLTLLQTFKYSEELNEEEIFTVGSKEEIWPIVAEQLKVDGYQVNEIQCESQWQNLVNQFKNEKAQAEREGSLSLWPYFTLVRHTLNTVKLLSETDKPTCVGPIRAKFSSDRPRVRKANPYKRSEESDDSSEAEMSDRSKVSAGLREKNSQTLKETPDKPPCDELRVIFRSDRRLVRKANRSNPSEESDDFCEAETSNPNKVSSRLREENSENLKAMRELTETMNGWHRVERLERIVGELVEQQIESRKQTNNILKQISTELTVFRNHVLPYYGVSFSNEDILTQLVSNVTFLDNSSLE